MNIWLIIVIILLFLILRSDTTEDYRRVSTRLRHKNRVRQGPKRRSKRGSKKIGQRSPKRHAILNKQNNVTSIQNVPPTQQSGEIDCVQINCPSHFGKDIVCWKCLER